LPDNRQVFTCMSSPSCAPRLSVRPEATSFQEVNRVGHGSHSLVMAGLGPAIHVFADGDQNCPYSASGNPFSSTYSLQEVNRVGHRSYLLVSLPGLARHRAWHARLHCCCSRAYTMRMEGLPGGDQAVTSLCTIIIDGMPRQHPS
jgi:hypothetical protein